MRCNTGAYVLLSSSKTEKHQYEKLPATKDFLYTVSQKKCGHKVYFEIKPKDTNCLKKTLTILSLDVRMAVTKKHIERKQKKSKCKSILSVNKKNLNAY